MEHERKLKQLRDLMAASGIEDAAMRKAVAGQGYRPEETPLEAYPDDLLDRLVSKWELVLPYAVKAMAETVEIPFN